MKNAEWMLQQGMEFSKLYWEYSNGKNVVYYLNGNVCKKVYSEECTIAKNLILKWLDMEHSEPVLDNAERRYLSTVIKPFKNQVRNIAKHYSSINSGKEYLAIITDGCWMMFPEFEASTMYKGMKPGHVYSLEELGL